MIRFRETIPSVSRFYLWRCFFIAAARHGVLEAMTDGGLGVAFFSPFAISGIFSRGDPSAFRQSASGGSSQKVVLP
jgi:hypothetical protein